MAREACGFDFAATCGQGRGREFIDCHHTTPLYVIGKTDTRIEDLALLCSNCRRMIHVRPPWLTVAELRDLIRTSD
jgi:5-methylcytosine-specific restriction protein A